MPRSYVDTYWTPDQIRALRMSRDWSREKLAEILGCRVTTVGRLEAGDIAPYDAVLQRLDDLAGRDRVFDQIEVD